MLETLYFRTKPSTRTRQPIKPPALTPHERVLEIRREPFPNEQRDIRALGLTATLACPIMQYHHGNFEQTDGVALCDVNCAHFVQTVVNEGNPDCIGSIKALDALRGDVIARPYTLAMGHVGVIATVEDLRDPEGWSHFLHAGIGIGREDEWLCVTGFRGDLAISSISADINYQQEVILPSEPGVYRHISPSSVRLFDYGLRPSAALALGDSVA